MSSVDCVNTILIGLPDRWPIPIPVSLVLSTLLAAVINFWVSFDMILDTFVNAELLSVDSSCQTTTFDYIIVGAGGAGMVVATRIANASSFASILLLEAGGEPSVLNDIPAFDAYLENQPANTWLYNSTEQTNACQNCDGKKVLTTRGKMLGGSTSTNFMMYVRGNKEDYNRWSTEDLGGDPQWNYENLLPYFKKSEDYNGAWASPKPRMPRPIMCFPRLMSQLKTLARAHTALFKDTGKPSNLCIKKYALVFKINFETVSEKPKAFSVTYQRQGLTQTVTATKEIILSAGTFGSAKLLMLSGVGPAHHLSSLDIPIVKDLPVGSQLQDHVTTIVGPFLKSQGVNPNRDLTVQAATEFLKSGTGLLAAPGTLTGQGFIKSPVAQPDYADIQMVHASASLYPKLPKDLNKMFGPRVDILESWFDPYHKQNVDARFGLLILGRPKSVGKLRLANRNPDDNPIMDLQYLRHPDDVEALLFGFKKFVDLYENTAALNTTLFPKPVPGCESFAFKSDDYYRCVIRSFSFSIYHHVGSCALGKVVDNQLK
ncbi:Oxygen-dependent choline dehydrogenase [Orchesella cincta]|uniref:Oxygen-dependent choline dehydrogenase n=1 Tax=Orchesella cincta TaxID=48709 RepID=A0A1D2ME23_ORCCI|nr:Oxygen-dependent choline dehydrogenase [Orchesella cincta]